MICPYCGSPNIESIGHNLYICYDCGEQFSVSFDRLKIVSFVRDGIDIPFRRIQLI